MTPTLVLALTILLGIPTPAEVTQAAQQVLGDSGIQQELPGPTGYSGWAPPPPEPSGEADPLPDDWTWNEDERDRPPAEGARTEPRDITRRDRDQGAGGGEGPALGNALMWLLLGVGVVVTVMWIARALSGYTRDAQAPSRASPVARPPPARLERPKTDAERLAEDGRYDEAIHVLLLETLRALDRHVPGGIRKSYTSREVLSRIELPSAAHPELESLVSAVETSLFGNDVSERIDYEACVGHFQRFADAYDAGHRAGTPA